MLYLSLILVKVSLLNVTYPEAIIYISVLLILLFKPVLEYKYPKRQDLFKEMHELHTQQSLLLNRFEEMESDLTAIKFGALRK